MVHQYLYDDGEYFYSPGLKGSTVSNVTKRGRNTWVSLIYSVVER